MPSFTTPARGRYPRSNISGRVPDVLAPGVPAYNWPDRKIHVGDPGGVPLLFSQLIREFQLEVAYQPGDIIIHDGEIWIANGSIPPNQPFDPADWQMLTSNTVSRFGEPVGSGLISGGALTIVGTSVQVAEGRGVIADTSNPGAMTFALVEWAAFAAPVPLVPDPTRLLACIDASGSFLLLDSLTIQPDTRRGLIVLGTIRVEAGVMTRSDQPLVAAGWVETYRDELQSGRTSGWRIWGASPIPGPSNDLRIAVTAGVTFTPGIKFQTDPDNPNTYEFGEGLLTLATYDRNGVVVAPGNSSVKAGFWDNGGVVQAVPADQFTIQFLTIGASGTAANAQLGQQLYPEAALAVSSVSAAYEDHVVAVREQGRIILGAVVVRGNATNLADPTQAVLVPAMLGRTTPFPWQPPPSSGLDLSAYYRLDGSRILTGHMNAGGFRIDNAIIDGGTY